MSGIEANILYLLGLLKAAIIAGIRVITGRGPDPSSSGAEMYIKIALECLCMI